MQISKFIVAALFSLGAFSETVAQDVPLDPEVHKDAMNNISAEYAKCAAYFTHVAASSHNAGDEDVSENYGAMSKSALDLAYKFALFDRSEKMAVDVTATRYEMAIESMTEEIEKDYSNFELLFQQYGRRCNFVMTDTEAFMQEWMDEASGD